jgi:hypothetical protein
VRDREADMLALCDLWVSCLAMPDEDYEVPAVGLGEAMAAMGLDLGNIDDVNYYQSLGAEFAPFLRATWARLRKLDPSPSELAPAPRD